MSIVFESRDTLLKPLQAIAGIVEKRHTLPILSNVLIEKHGEQLKLSATDLEIEIQTRTQGDFDTSDIAFTVSAKKLIDILRAIPDQKSVTIDLDQSKATVKSGKSRFTLQTLPAQDFPRLQVDELGSALRLPQSTLKRLLERVLYAMAQQDIRYYLNGLLLVLEGQQLQAIATDGHRLAFAATTVTGTHPKREVILPRKTVLELNKLLHETDDEVLIEYGHNQVRFSIDSSVMTTKVIDGKFPDYQRVIPQNNNKVITVQRVILQQALQRAAILSNEKFRGVNLSLANHELKIACNNSEQEEAEEIVEVEYPHSPLNIGFNITYLLDVLNNNDGENINCAFGDNSGSALFTLPDDEQFKYIVMPMRV